jgi:hypothetical protein
MKKLLIVPLFGLLAWLGSCSYSSLVRLTPSEIIRQEHAAVNSSLPSIPSLPQITVPTFNPPQQPTVHKPVSHRGVAAKTSPKVVPTPIPYVAEEPSVVTPELECIFPLSLIPGCRPQQ